MARKRDGHASTSPTTPENPKDKVQRDCHKKARTRSTAFGRWSKRLAAHPVFTVLAGLASLAGLITGAVFFILSLRSPDLVVYEQPIRTILAQNIDSSQLKVEYRGTPIRSGYLVAAHFTIWNAGRLATEASDVLKGFQFTTAPSAPILDATITKCTREECQVRLDTDRAKLDSGHLPISWHILEQNDAAQIQIVFDGDPKTACSLQGTIKSQGAPRSARLVNSALSRNAGRWLGYLGIMIVAMVPAARRFRRWRRIVLKTVQNTTSTLEAGDKQVEAARATVKATREDILVLRDSCARSGMDPDAAGRLLDIVDAVTVRNLDLTETLQANSRELASHNANLANDTLDAFRSTLVLFTAAAVVFLVLVVLSFTLVDSVPFLS